MWTQVRKGVGKERCGDGDAGELCVGGGGEEVRGESGRGWWRGGGCRGGRCLGSVGGVRGGSSCGCGCAAATPACVRQHTSAYVSTR